VWTRQNAHPTSNASIHLNGYPARNPILLDCSRAAPLQTTGIFTMTTPNGMRMPFLDPMKIFLMNPFLYKRMQWVLEKKVIRFHMFSYTGDLATSARFTFLREEKYLLQFKNLSNFPVTGETHVSLNDFGLNHIL